MRVGRYEKLDGSSLKPPVRMDNGFLRVEGRIARVGIQEYRRADGSVSRELRLPEEVFHPDSLASFVQLPVTNCHPPGMLTAKNAKKYSVGAVGENVRQDGDYIAAPLMLHDADAIEAVEKGRSQLSNGYSCELDTTQDPALVAKWGKYDAIMRNIRGNHVALVDVARAGPGASLRLDSNEACALELLSIADSMEKPMHKLVMDGLTFEVSDANAQASFDRAIKSVTERADAAEKALAGKDKTITELTAKLDVSEAARKSEAEKSANLEATRADEIKRVIALGAEVSKHGVDVSKLDATEVAYKSAALAKLSPDVKLDGKDAAYINAAYDVAVSIAAKQPTALDLARAGIVEGTPRADAAPSSNADEARRRYNERLFSVAK